MIENFAIVTLKTYNEKVNIKNLMLNMLKKIFWSTCITILHLPFFLYMESSSNTIK